MAETNKDDLIIIKKLETLSGKKIPFVKDQQLSWADIGYQTDDKGHVTELSLSDLKLKSMLIVCSLKHLRKLSLSDNLLSTIPKKIKELANLKEFYLPNNHIKQIPDEITELTNLEIFDISNNRLSSLPDSINELKNLRILYVNNNALHDVSEGIKGLKNLTELYLSNNHLRSIPKEIGTFTKLKKFYLNKNNLRDIPESIGELTNLIELSLSSNSLNRLPEGISNLKNLTLLPLSNNCLTELPEGIKELQNLNELYLSNNKLSYIPESIGKLKNLTRFDLSNNQLTNVPQGIKELKYLTVLTLSFNQLNSIPEWIGNLRHLTTVSLFHNKLESIPNTITDLTNLIELNLSFNQLRVLPKTIGQLANLRELDLSANQLTTIPKELTKLTGLIKLNLARNQINIITKDFMEIPLSILWIADYFYDKGINLYGNPLESPPIEILKQGENSIKQYFAAMKKSKKVLNEAKILFVGNGGAGKTSVIRRAFGERFDKNESQTKGIVIRSQRYIINDQQVKAHFWDFGGQVIMHATHQLFLSHRSLYVFVLDGRKEEDAEYWLQLIESFGGKSPILVVMNKIDDNRAFELNRRFLQDKYKGIVGFYRVSCKEDEGFDGKNGLIGGIKTAIEKVEMLRSKWPKSWIRVKEKLEAMKYRQEHFISAQEYQKICDKSGISDEDEQDTLVGYLHDLGIILHFPGLNLADMHILEPHWVTDAVYRIINSKILADNHGDLHVDDLKGILKKRKLDNYSYTGKYGYIVELMQKFELCFSFPDGGGHYLVPELLDKQQPVEADNFTGNECLNFSYCYPILPEGLMPRFIVRTHILSRGLPRWRTGVILRLEDNEALVIADVKAKRIFVRVKGPVPGRQRLLAVIRSDFEHIHSNFTFKTEELVAVPHYPDVEVKYKDLLVREKQGVKQFSQVIEDKDVVLDVEELLNGVDMQGVRRLDREQEPKLIRLFYSYSHNDEQLRNELETHLKILQRTGRIQEWHDRKFTAGDEWKGKIDENLNKADIILLLISSDFIASDYCWDVEMRRAMERHETNKAKVIPVILRDVNWSGAPFCKLQALPKDAKAVTLWANKDTAWRDVSDGIEKVVREIHAKTK